MLFSREQEFKKVFIQFGIKFNLPKDIIIFIYNILRKDKIKLIEQSRKFHLNNIYFEIYDRLGVDNKHRNFYCDGFTEKNICWIIGNEYKHIEFIANNCSKQFTPRDICLLQIKMIGTDDFFLERDCYWGKFPRDVQRSIRDHLRIRAPTRNHYI